MSVALAHDNGSIVEYTPASALVCGKTLTERKISVLNGATSEAITYLSTQNGKVGKMARAGLREYSVHAIASSARRGNYQPLAEAIAGITGESLSISNRAAFEALGDRFQDKLHDLALSKNGGYVLRKKDSVMVPSAKRNTLDQVIALVAKVKEIASQM
jgi:hypothetical protein